MITFLEGKLVDKHPTRVVISVSGVGYEVFIPLSSYDHLPASGHSCRILTHHYVREDAHILYGFVTTGERHMFELLLTIAGIGPKIALSALSGLSVRELKAAVVESDIARLNSISGVGRKTAERIVIELRDKLTEGEALEALSDDHKMASGDIRMHDAVLALISLGYKQADAQKMIRQVLASGAEDKNVEDIVREALTS